MGFSIFFPFMLALGTASIAYEPLANRLCEDFSQCYCNTNQTQDVFNLLLLALTCTNYSMYFLLPSFLSPLGMVLVIAMLHDAMAPYSRLPNLRHIHNQPHRRQIPFFETDF